MTWIYGGFIFYWCYCHELQVQKTKDPVFRPQPNIIDSHLCIHGTNSLKNPHLDKTELTEVPIAICYINTSLHFLNFRNTPIWHLNLLPCTISIRSLSLSNTNISVIDPLFFNNVQVCILYVEGLKWSKIPMEISRLGKNLEILHLNRNPITDIEPGTFRNNSRLTELHLSSTHLKEIPSEVYTLKQRLEKLDLSYLPNVNIMANSFCAMKKLLVLRLYGMRNTAQNQIVQALQCLEMLQHLFLDWSAVSALGEVMKNNWDLQVIHFDANFEEKECKALPDLTEVLCATRRKFYFRIEGVMIYFFIHLVIDFIH